MLIPLHCFECKEGKTLKVDLNDTGIYRGTCENGHSLEWVMSQFVFELLSEIGLTAIYDGYYREAVSSFASCLERFYEFYVKIICNKNEIKLQQFAATWKKVASQSERQLGAFMFIYLMETGVEPPVLSQKEVKFRNEVIHKGAIPGKAETIHFAQAVLNVVNKILIPLKSNELILLSNAVFFRNLSLQTSLTDSKGFISLNTLISLQRSPKDDLDVVTALTKIPAKREWKRQMYGEDSEG